MPAPNRKPPRPANKPEIAVPESQRPIRTEDLRFFSPDGTPIHVPLPDGSKAIVLGLDQARSLPARFVRAAAAAGCMTTALAHLPRDVINPQTPASADPQLRNKLILEAIADAVNGEEDSEEFEGAFTTTGIPNVAWLSARVGFTVDRSERDSAWNEVKKALDRDAENNPPKKDDGEGGAG